MTDNRYEDNLSDTDTGTDTVQTVTGQAAAGEAHIRIPVQRGHVDALRFWFAPVSRAIMNADADWLTEEELSCDNLATHELFLPFLLKYHKGKFRWKDEINLLSFKAVRQMVAEVRHISSLLASDYDNPELDPIKKHISLDLLVSYEDYQAHYLDLGEAEKEQAVASHIDVVIDFYSQITDYLDEMLTKYRPLGFNAIAVCAPH